MQAASATSSTLNDWARCSLMNRRARWIPPCATEVTSVLCRVMIRAESIRTGFAGGRAPAIRLSSRAAPR